jgi:phosphotransferase system enzyme I (PtsI)
MNKEIKEIKLTGIPIIPGKAVGKAFFPGRSFRTFERQSIHEADVGSQIILFNHIREKAKTQYRSLASRIETVESPMADSSVVDIYVSILDDPAFIGQVVNTISQKLFSLETAIHLVSNEFIRRFDEMQSSYFKERGNDVVEICEKLVSMLNKDEVEHPITEPVIIVIPRTFVPSDILAYENSMIKGVVALNAGATSHAAILARAYEIPLISDLKLMKKAIKPDDMLMIDGYKGVVYVNPIATRVQTVTSEEKRKQKLSDFCKKWQREAYSRDGAQVTVNANTALPEDIQSAMVHGADGIGLVRTELLYFENNRLPTHDEQVSYFKALFRHAKGKNLIIRLLDIGGDKIPLFLRMPKEFNPFMGWRGIRVLLKRKDIFRSHVTAIIKAAGEREYSIMAPMVSTLSEWLQAKDFIHEIALKLNAPIPRLGVLFEVPVALMEMRSFIDHIDFASIGTNDLIQYLFAADRNNPNVNYLHNPLDPAFLNILKTAISTAKDKGIPISICGEMAGFPLYTILLIGLGLRQFSVAPHVIPLLKEMISRISFSEAQERINHLLQLFSPEEMATALGKINRDIFGSFYAEIQEFIDPFGTETTH